MTAVTVPIVSVIIPVYNRADLLKEALQSIADQKVGLREAGKVEIIVVDDGSVDAPDRVTDELRRSISLPLTCIRQSHTGMPGQARNKGAAAAGGRYLAFLDSDDLWLPDKLEKQLAFFKRNQDILFCHAREIWLRNGKEVSQAGQKHRRSGNVFTDAVKKCIIGPSTVMMTRHLFEETGGFREDLEIAEDYEYWLRITDTHEVGYIDEPLVKKRAGDWEQLSEKYGHIELFRLQGLRNLVDRRIFIPEHQTAAALELADKCRIYAAGCRKRGREEEAAKYEEMAAKYGKPGLRGG